MNYGEIMEVVNASELKKYILRLEEINNDKKDLQIIMRSVFDEMEGKGFPKHYIKQTLRLRALTKAQAEEELDIVQTYLKAIG